MGKSVYLIAFVALVAIFFVTIFSIKMYEDQVLYNINEQLRQIQLDNQFESIIYDLVENPEVYCEARNIQLSNNSRKLERLDLELKVQRDVFLGNYSQTKRAFLMTNLLLYYNVVKVNNECDENIIPVIYFYSEGKDCEVECGAMENQLENLKNYCDSLRVFAFPFNWEHFEFSRVLEREFGVTKPGTIIINENKFDSVVPQRELENALNCN